MLVVIRPLFKMKPKLQRKILASSLIGLFMGILSAFVTMYAAWDHNPYNEIHNQVTGAINWSYWLSIGTSWLIVVSFSFAIISFVCTSIFEIISKYIKKQTTAV